MYNKRFTAIVLVLALGLVFLGGCCAKCYKVTDTSTNTVYYTHDVDRECDGSVGIRLAGTQNAWSFGEKVRLQSAQVERVSNCECKRHGHKGECPSPCPKTFPCPGKSPCTPGSV